ncbi:outer membrane protein transport protein [Pseudomonas sp. PA-1-3F]|uniref:outer membrane protein transport protein n=1 Tax=Pseudomonas sp. PA-1-3F TaxID=2665465 RepID=UPI001F94E9BE|nr:transporter [Pseudomonas sp. PA-1-3F]
MKKKLLNSIFAIAMSALSIEVLANGIAINEQSASSAGTAYAGRASSALDASTIYGNPAGLSKLKQTEISGGFAVIDASDDIHSPSSSATGTNKGDSVPFTVVPFGYLSTPLDDLWSVGAGIYAPYGLINDYEDGFQGRYHGDYSMVKVVTLQPTFSYRINDSIAIGGGPTINRISGKLQNDLSTGALNNGRGDTHITIKGDDIALGYNLGVLIDLAPSTTWGLSYHSKVKYKLEGHTRVENSPAVFALNGKYDTKLDITLPETVDTSFTHHFNERWTGYLGATWTRWSRLQKIEAQNSGVPPLGQRLGFNKIGEPLNWEDTWSVAIGAAYQFSPKWLLRSGFAYDPSPTTNADRNVRIPVGIRRSVTLGAAYSPDKDITIDIAYAYIWENESSVNQGNSSGLQPAYSANYDNSGHALSAQLTHRF